MFARDYGCVHPGMPLYLTHFRPESSYASNDEYCLIVNPISLADLQQVLVFFQSISQDGVANGFHRSQFLFSDDSLYFMSVLLITAVIDAICIKKQDVSSAHKRNLSYIGEVQLSLSQLDGDILASIRIVFWNFESERKEMHHTVLIHLHELAVFGGEDQRRGVPEVDNTEVSIRVDLPIQHCRNFTGSIGASSQSVPCRDRLCEPQVDFFNQIRCCLAVSVEL